MHARTPGKHQHSYMNIDLGTAKLSSCLECEWWWIQPSLAPAEPDRERGDQGQRNGDRHSDDQSLVASAEREARKFYGEPMGKHRAAGSSVG